MRIPSESQIRIWNEQIEMDRSIQYRQQSDPLFMAYQKYLALGDTEKAEVKKAEWIAMVKDIAEKNPYYDLLDDKTTTTATAE